MLTSSLVFYPDLLNADQILSKWGEDRKQLSRSLRTDEPMIEWKSIIPIDSCSSGVGNPTCIRGVCKGCVVCGRLFDNGVIVLDKKTTVLKGTRTGLQFHVFQTDGSLKGYRKKEKAFSCQGSLFENYALISACLGYEMEKFKLPTTPPFLWLWQCKNEINVVDQYLNLGNGLSLMKLSSEYNNRKRFNPSVLNGIVGQLLSTLHCVSRYKFHHGAESIMSLGFTNNICSYSYDGKSISSPITLRLIPSGVSALSIATQYSISGKKAVRFFHSNGENKTKPELIEDQYYVSPKLMYQIQSSGSDILVDSYGLYAFMTALLCDKMFYDSFCDSKYLSLLNELFLPNEIDLYLKSVQQNHDKESPNCLEIVNILSSFQLFRGVISSVWEVYKTK
jgi:hypothetical protein